MKAAGHWALPRRGRGARGLCLPPSHSSPWPESRSPPRRPGPPPSSQARPGGNAPAAPGRETLRGGREQPAVADSRPGGAGAAALRRSHRDSTRPGAARSAAGAGPALPPSLLPAGRAPRPGESGRAGTPRCRATRTAPGAAGPEPGRPRFGERPGFARGMPFHLHFP